MNYSLSHLLSQEYNKLIELPDVPPDVWTYLACTRFFLGMYKEAEDACKKGPASKLQNRLMFHLSHKVYDLICSSYDHLKSYLYP